MIWPSDLLYALYERVDSLENRAVDLWHGLQLGRAAVAQLQCDLEAQQQEYVELARSLQSEGIDVRQYLQPGNILAIFDPSIRVKVRLRQHALRELDRDPENSQHSDAVEF